VVDSESKPVEGEEVQQIEQIDTKVAQKELQPQPV